MAELRPLVEEDKVSSAYVETSGVDLVPELCFQFLKGRFAPLLAAFPVARGHLLSLSLEGG